jgi:hypothetical protein
MRVGEIQNTTNLFQMSKDRGFNGATADMSISLKRFPGSKCRYQPVFHWRKFAAGNEDGLKRFLNIRQLRYQARRQSTLAVRALGGVPAT